MLTAELKDLFKQVYQYKSHPYGSELAATVANWEQLNEIQKELLIDDISDFLRTQKEIQATLNFMKSVSGTYPKNDFANLIVGLGFFLIPVAFIVEESLRDWIKGTLYVVGALVLLMTFALVTESISIKSWARKTLIPQIKRHKIDIDQFVQLSETFNSKPDSRLKSVNEAFASMCKEAEKIYTILLAAKLKGL